ncbi:unnamed protein product [Leptidea sinapis]|uniref:Uncharacterized protein n=1 Tax=Leptidea sinapis TaxID=189913 RepID=A0A5E4Q4X5_9NEOP|nr:unnamed protein product [Leptidea sinapis]
MKQITAIFGPGVNRVVIRDFILRRVATYVYRFYYKKRCIFISLDSVVKKNICVVPLILIIDIILRDEDDMTKVFLHYCCQLIDQVLFRDHLYSFKSYWNFNYYIYLSKTEACNSSHQISSCRYEEPIKTNRLNINLLEICSSNQYLLCGSTDFMNHFHEHLLSCNVPTQNIILF